MDIKFPWPNLSFVNGPLVCTTKEQNSLKAGTKMWLIFFPIVSFQKNSKSELTNLRFVGECERAKGWHLLLLMCCGWELSPLKYIAIATSRRVDFDFQPTRIDARSLWLRLFLSSLKLSITIEQVSIKYQQRTDRWRREVFLLHSPLVISQSYVGT